MKTYTSIIRFLLALPLLGQISLHAEQSAEAASKTLDDRPNLVFLMMDDQRWDTLGCYGRTDVLTPNIDKLAAEGVDLSHLVKGTQDMNQWRDAVLMENFFIEELYDLKADPHEQTNLVSNPEYADVLTQFRSKTQELYTLATD
ncbi:MULTISPECIES: sulfatase-like hydrolase/transferase [unclassified Lentimonas]|uniref:sulfatase-like hydrolase/transferase n=1 Tax=unclassified Lentimonas TaxID=2630993 RepID=UPI0013263CC8|nr:MULTISPECIES: sulfatase-like hydrolase/transferase [unclassified Lentimonas]CAA6677797.1 Choline-sulfatase (EC [Lentimonas sp. CC4]CAA6683899.1 Choline-sulfatase (EC [Lentimonas sp. CC6]CAA7076723.1 Choline-sulfatase (EC [Lentimonas sp. CC4]CAA7169942.1 Choline-sulfatase (EC [Lentimonas sp. CC21]CAA7181231.1 Choline-sulfatase (EC [Lentimonas sp. CC8]